MPKLTQRYITSLQPRVKVFQIWDTEVKGLWVMVQPSGTKSYGIDYRTVPGRAGKKRHFRLGDSASLSLEHARALAKQYLLNVRHHHIDPLMQRQTVQEQMTVQGLAARYLAEHADVKKKPRSAEMDHVNLRLHILPALGSKAVRTLSQDDIATFHHRLRGKPGAANRCLAVLSKMFALAESWGVRERGSNPVRGIERYREHARERFLSGKELARLGAALTQAEAMNTEHPSVLACIRLLLLTGARLGEILTLQWHMIDWERSVARLPDSKTGAKTLRLPQPALDILRRLPRTAETPWVLPGRRRGKPLINLRKPWVRLCAAAGIMEVRLHDLRHTYASVSVMAGLSLPMVGKLLGHTHQSTTARYTHLADDPVRQAAEQAGELINHALGIETPRAYTEE